MSEHAHVAQATMRRGCKSSTAQHKEREKHMSEAKKKQPKVEVLIYPEKEGDMNAVFMLFEGGPNDIDFRTAKKVLHCNEWIDLTGMGKTNLIPTIRGSRYGHVFRVDGKIVPQEIKEVNGVDDSVTLKAIYKGDTSEKIAKRGEVTEEEKALYDYIVSF